MEHAQACSVVDILKLIHEGDSTRRCSRLAIITVATCCYYGGEGTLFTAVIFFYIVMSVKTLGGF